jgi:hypothetical protein
LVKIRTSRIVNRMFLGQVLLDRGGLRRSPVTTGCARDLFVGTALLATTTIPPR